MVIAHESNGIKAKKIIDESGRTSHQAYKKKTKSTNDVMNPMDQKRNSRLQDSCHEVLEVDSSPSSDEDTSNMQPQYLK